MAKAFYTQDEAASALATDDDGLKALVDDGRLTEYRDGANLMYKGSQIEQLASEGAGGLGPADSGGPIGLADSTGGSMTGSMGGMSGIFEDDDSGRSAAGRSTGGSLSGTSGESEIGLADSSLGSSDLGDSDINLADSASSGGRSSSGSRVPGSSGAPLLANDDTGSFASVEGEFDDTNLGGTSAGSLAGASQSGITIFEDDDVDPSAQTSLGGTGDQVALEGIGSGSGLLDLTQEPDDTSFGAETFDEIMPEGSVAGGTVSGIGDSGVGIDTAAAPAGTRQVSGGAVAYEVYDPSAPIFGGLAAGAAFAVLVGLLALVLSLAGDAGFLSFLVGEDGVALGPALGLLVGLPVIGAIIGLVGGKMASA